MISCAYALLYLNPKTILRYSTVATIDNPIETVPALESLVILGNQPKNPFYNFYEVPIDRHFPLADPKYDIVSTQIKADEMKNKIIAYCSPTLSTMKIIEIVTHGLTPKIRDYNSESDPATPSEKDCWKIIQKQWNRVSDVSSSGRKEIARNNKCSNRDIISLAHRGLLAVTGIYSKMAPINKEGVPVVNINSQMNLHELASPEHIIGTWYIRDTQKVLIWYFGHPHIFRRKRGDNVWIPATIIGAEQENVATLLNFMRYDLELFVTLDDRVREYRRLVKSNENCLKVLTCVPLDMEDKSNQIMAEINSMMINRPNWRDIYILSNPF